MAAAPISVGPSEEPDWTDQVTDLIVDVVDRVHDRTTGPLIQASRWLVFGALAVFVGSVLLVIGLILIGRLLGLLPFDIWIAYVVIGTVFFAAGTWLWARRDRGEQ